MTELDQKIDALVRPFVAQLAKLFSEHAIASFEQALGRVATSSSPAPNKVAARPSRPLGDLQARLSSHLAANPGQRMDQLNKSLDVPVAKLQRAIAKLLSSGAVRREGERRGVRYYATS